MKIQQKNDGSIPPFEIIPTPERKIIERFTDKETQYLVVVETNMTDPNDRKTYYTLINPKTGEVISTQQRSKEIAASGKDQVLEDQQHGLRLHTLHTVNLQTGDEELHETLTETTTGRVVAEQWSTALRKQSRETLFTSYLAKQSEQQSGATFWTGEYAQWPFEQRAVYWLDALLRQMRFQSEAGYDEYAYFTPENYAEWQDHEPNMDRILEFIIEHFPDDNEEFRAEVYRRLGKSQP